MSDSSLVNTNFQFPNQTSVYKGKVRDVYMLNQHRLVMIITDRISAFDTILPKGIPHKGEILNFIALHFLAQTQDIVPNWVEASPHPNVSVGKYCRPIKIEMVVRKYLTGHAWREYSKGKRMLCGVRLPNGLNENDPFEEPIITPTTKAEVGGKDMDISKEAIISKKIIAEADYSALESYSLKLFERGSEIAQKKGLILVDTKYEFGQFDDGSLMLIDEIHTPDSSRYFYADTYERHQRERKPQRQLSKEFVRQWLIKEGFNGMSNQIIPKMTETVIQDISNRYIELYEALVGKKFVPKTISEKGIQFDVSQKVNGYLLG